MLDKIISFFSPKTAYKRAQYRAAKKILEKRLYEGASRTRRTAGWATQSTSQNAEAANAIEILRNRSRDLVRNNPWAARGVTLISTNTVGKGIQASFSASTPERADFFQTAWESWTSTRDVDFGCNLNFSQIQNLVMRSVVESGEILIRRRRVRRTGNNLPIKLQVLEADHIVTNRIFQNSENGNRVIMGVEIDDNDCVVAYHLYENHPGNFGVDAKAATSPLSIVRVPAEDIIHVFRTDRPGQLRGVPWLAPVMIRLRELDEMEDAQLVKQKVAACFSAFIHDIEPPPRDPSLEEDEFDLEKLEPGIVEHLPPGKDIKFASPPTPEAGAYQEYLSSVLHSIAAGLGVSYEALTGDLSQVNFSSARMGWLEFQRNIDSWRTNLINPHFNWRVFKWFLEALEILGETTNDVRVSWIAPNREMIDPTKEIPAMQKAVRSGFSSLSEILRSLGKNPEDHFNQIAKDNEIIDNLNLTLDVDPRKVTATGVAQSE